MKKNTEKPSFKVIYILKFPKFVTTWRLKYITKDGFFIFSTSSARDTEKMNLNRFQDLCNRFLIDTVLLSDLGLKNEPQAPIDKIKITIERSNAFRSKTYSPGEFDSLVDNIDDIEF